LTNKCLGATSVGDYSGACGQPFLFISRVKAFTRLITNESTP